jgi:toxoflavin synthase
MMLQEDQRSPQALYDNTANGWVRNAPLSLSDFTGRPPVLALCEPVVGKRVLDLGCGEGYCARKLQASGAGEVIGVDLSQAMIDAAQREESRSPLGIRYAQGSATDLSRFADGEMDLVLAMFLFNYLTVEETRVCMTEVARVLKPGGRFVFAVPHPSLPSMRDAEPPFYFEVGDGGYFSSRDKRFAGRIWKRDGTVLDVQLVHKTVEDYFACLNAAGFRSMPTVRELRVTPEILSVDPKFFSPLLDTPLHLAMSVDR